MLLTPMRRITFIVKCRTKNPWKLFSKQWAQLKSPSSSRCLKPWAYRISRWVRTSTTHSAEHFVGRYSIPLADLWLSSFPPAWRKKRGYYFKATSRKKRYEDQLLNHPIHGFILSGGIWRR